MTGERANYSCPDCGSSDVFRDRGKVFECESCGQQVHEGVLERYDTLERLAGRDDDVGAIATRLVETKGVCE